jgi:hypothetical protein
MFSDGHGLNETRCSKDCTEGVVQQGLQHGQLYNCVDNEYLRIADCDVFQISAILCLHECNKGRYIVGNQ